MTSKQPKRTAIRGIWFNPEAREQLEDGLLKAKRKWKKFVTADDTKKMLENPDGSLSLIGKNYLSATHEYEDSHDIASLDSTMVKNMIVEVEWVAVSNDNFWFMFNK